MSIPVFPDLSRLGEGFSSHKWPRNSTLTAQHASGREVRVPLYAQPLYDFELTYNALASNGQYAGIGRDTLQLLMGFFNDLSGSFGTFLFTDRTDNGGTRIPLSPIGDSSIMTFTFQRALRSVFEPIGYVSYISAVYWAGVAQVGNWTLANPTAAVPYPNLTFTSAPGAGVVVSADFNWQFVCRSSDDTLDFEQFMADLWALKSWKFQSVRNGGF